MLCRRIHHMHKAYAAVECIEAASIHDVLVVNSSMKTIVGRDNCAYIGHAHSWWCAPQLPAICMYECCGLCVVRESSVPAQRAGTELSSTIRLWPTLVSAV